MKEENTSIRLKKIMSQQRLKQIDLLNKCKPICEKYNKLYNKKIHISKSDLSQWLSGLYEPSQSKLTILAEALDVNEVWLMGYDIDYEKTKTITIYEKDFLTLDKDFLGIQKGTEIPFDYLLLYIEAIYGTLSLSKANLMLVDTLIETLKQKNDDELLKVISKFITEAIDDIDDIENLQSAITTSRKESINVLYKLSDFIRKRDSNELKNNINEEDMKKIEDYINMEMKNPNITGKKVKFKFNDEVYYLSNKINDSAAKVNNKVKDINNN